MFLLRLIIISQPIRAIYQQPCASSIVVEKTRGQKLGMLSLLKHWYQRHFSQPGTIEFAVVLIATFITVYYFMWLVGPLVVALCLAFCLDWPVEKLKRRFGIGRKIGSCIVMTIFSSFITICVLVAPNVIKQGAELYNSIVSFSTVDPEKQAVYDQQALLAAS